MAQAYGTLSQKIDIDYSHIISEVGESSFILFQHTRWVDGILLRDHFLSLDAVALDGDAHVFDYVELRSSQVMWSFPLFMMPSRRMICLELPQHARLLLKDSPH